MQPIRIFGDPFRAYGQGGGVGISLNDYLISLGAVLLFDGTLSGSNIKNLGSGGAALDGVPTDIVIDANGMNYNGTTSVITVANNALLSGLSEFTYAFWLNPSAAGGEGTSPRIWNWGNASQFGIHTEGTASLRVDVGFTGGTATSASSTSANAFITQGSEQWLFAQLSSSDKKIRLYKGIAGAVSEASYTGQVAGDSTVANQVGSLYIGNRQSNDSTFADYIKRVVIFSAELTAAQRLQITQRSGL